MNDGKMFDLLGYYYDGHERYLQQIPNNVQFTIRGTVKGFQGNQILIDYEMFSKAREPDKKTQSLNFANTLNFLVPNFCVADTYGGVQVVENATIVTTYNGKEISKLEKSLGQFEFNHFFVKLIESLGHVPLTFDLQFDVTRQTNAEGRRQYLDRKRNNLTPEQYFHKMLGVDFAQNETGDHNLTNYYKRKNAFKGEFKSRLFCINPQSIVFLIEYLYGKKVPKNSTYRQLFNKLAAYSYNDFGIKDVQVLQKLMEMLSNSRYNSEKQFYEKLQAIGIKPATDLARWQKIIQPKPMVANTTSNDLPF